MKRLTHAERVALYQRKIARLEAELAQRDGKEWEHAIQYAVRLIDQAIKETADG